MTFTGWMPFLLKVKGLDIYIPPLMGKLWPGVVYSSKWHTGQQWHNTISSRPLPKWLDFGPHSLQLDRLAYAPASHTMAFTLQFFSFNDSIFSLASITRWKA